MPTLVSLEHLAGDNCLSPGGIKVSYALILQDLTAVTLTNLEASAFTPNGAAWFKLQYDKTGATFKQTNNAEGTKLTYDGEAVMPFKRTDTAVIDAMNKYAECRCGIVLVHFMNSGSKFAQGIQVNAAKDDYEESLDVCRVNPSLDSGDLDGEAVVTFTAVSKSRNVLRVADALEEADFEA